MFETLVSAPTSQSTTDSPRAGVERRARDRHPIRVRRNLRGHLFKSLVRLVVLLTVDVVAILLGRALLRAVWMGTFGSGMARFVSTLLPNTAISGPQLATAVVAALFFFGCYRAGDRWRDPVLILAAAGTGVLMALYGDLWHGATAVVLGRGLLIWTSLGLTLVAYRNGAHMLTKRLPRPGLGQRVLEVHAGARPHQLELGPRYQILATLDVQDLPDDIEEMEDWLEGGIDTILVSGEVPSERFAQITDFALSHGCQLLTVPRSRELIGVDPNRIWIKGTPLFQLTTPSLRASHLVLKRCIDIFGSLLLLVLFSPLMLLIGLAVKLDSPGAVFFRHRRAGMGGRYFGLLKFRSMKAEAEQLLMADPDLYRRYAENSFKLPENEDPRITRVGRILRKTSLDELPQLLNVLMGDMSLVGPRPVVEAELEMYRGRIPTFLSVRPGVTGLWQISGRSTVGFPERAEMDLAYVRRWSLLEDLWILLMTVPVVLFRRGAH